MHQAVGGRRLFCCWALSFLEAAKEAREATADSFHFPWRCWAGKLRSGVKADYTTYLQKSHHLPESRPIEQHRAREQGKTELFCGLCGFKIRLFLALCCSMDRLFRERCDLCKFLVALSRSEVHPLQCWTRGARRRFFGLFESTKNKKR